MPDFKKLEAFLTELKANNRKEWFDANRPRYEALRQEWLLFIEQVLTGVGEFDEQVRHLVPKQCMFRINRDIRFSPDKSPYKTNFSLIISEGAKKLERAGYYFHFEPGEVFAGGGIYMPSSPALKAIRQEIDYQSERFVKIVESKSFKSAFGAVSGPSLKTMPKGYPTDHPLAAYLKQTSYLGTCNISLKELLAQKDPAKWLIGIFKALQPFNQFINACLSHSELES